MRVTMDAAEALASVNWAVYARCMNCGAADGTPCMGQFWAGSYATGDRRVESGVLPMPHQRQTIAERAAWHETYARYLADTIEAVTVATGAEIRKSDDGRFWELAVSRWSASLPICVCEIDAGFPSGRPTCAKLGTGDVGAGNGHGGACDVAGKNPCHGWHTARLIALVERVRKPTTVTLRSVGVRAAAPKAPKSDPTPEQVAKIQAKSDRVFLGLDVA